MKRYLALALVFASSTSLLFAADTASITIGGAVSKTGSISLTPAPGYNALDLTTGPVTPTTVATVTEACNSATGYSVTLQSANSTAGQPYFKGTIGATPAILNYDVTYAGAPVIFTGNQAPLTPSGTATAGLQKALAVSYTGTALPGDTYSDTLTVTMVVN